MLRIPICRWRRPPSETRENPASAFDRAPFASGGWWLNRAAFRDDAGKKIAQYKIKTRTPDTPIAALSGGNVQRAVLAREARGRSRSADRRQSLLRSGFRRGGANPCRNHGGAIGMPTKRLADPDDFGAFCALLCSDYANSIVGQNLVIDGGTIHGMF